MIYHLPIFTFTKNDSPYDDFRSEASTITSRSPDSTTSSSRGRHEKLPLNGILKRRPDKENNLKPVNDNSDCAVPITQAAIDKIRETELEDVLQYARDIVNPDPSARMTFSYQPAKVVEGSFCHLLSIKEIHSKTGAFKHRTIEINRNCEDELGFSVRQGDGWEKKDGIYISRVSLGSVFDQYEIMTVGDQLIKVNKVDVTRMNVEDVIRLMHIPDRLSVTIKMLTPFSKKRVEKSGINEMKSKQNKFLATPSSESIYKVAQMKIGSNERRHILRPKRAILVNNKNNPSKDQKVVRISPYRTMEDGTSLPLSYKNHLSPIREVSSEIRLEDSVKQRRQSYVTWSDQRSVTSEPI